VNRTEQQRLALAAAQERNSERAELERQARFDDFMFLVKAGEAPAVAAKRVGSNPIALVRQAYRWERNDIAKILNPDARRIRLGI
jgi:hypothetical protein